MQQRCTCGAVLPDDARFCHKCGKPQYEEDIARLTETHPPAPVQAPIEPPLETSSALSKFRAVAISIGMALASLLVSSVVAQVSPFLVFLVLVAAGFGTAAAYRRSTTTPLSGLTGALLGCLTGLWLFLMFAIAIMSRSGAQIMEQLKQMPQFAELRIQDPRSLMLGMSISGFFLLTFLPGLGGMLAAALRAKGRSSS